MDLRKQIESASRGTMGFLEAKDKDSFMTGVGVAISLYEKFHKDEVEFLKRQVEASKSICETYSNDLKTLSSIINKYSDNE